MGCRVVVLMGLLVASLPGLVQGQASSARKSKAAAAAEPLFTPEREAAALVFVERHHPELSALLERLKPMNEAEYEKAVVELFNLSESLAELSRRDPKKHELALEAWKARLRVQLLTAQLAGDPSRRAERESSLRQVLEDQLDIELAQQELERAYAEARLNKIKDNVDRLKRERASLLETRFRGLVNRSRNARKPDVAWRNGRGERRKEEAGNGRPGGVSVPTARGPAHKCRRGKRTMRRYLLMSCCGIALGLTFLSSLASADDVLRPARERFAVADTQEVPDFQRHLLPLMGRLGCNTRSCHGSFQGQGGFRLSLFGYDFKADHEAPHGQG